MANNCFLPDAHARAVAALLAQWPGVAGLVCLLLWAACDLAGAAWAALRHRPELLSELSARRPGAAGALQQAMDAEAGLDHATLALMRAALPALPAALLGLLLGEGAKLVRCDGGAVMAVLGCLQCLLAAPPAGSLAYNCTAAACTRSPALPPNPAAMPCHARQVDHELSVPAVTAILLSVAAACVATAADLLMSGGLTRVAHEALVAAGPLGTGALWCWHAGQGAAQGGGLQQCVSCHQPGC